MCMVRSGKVFRTASTMNRSQPGRYLSFTRGKPASTAPWIFSISRSSESWIPKSAPTATRSAVPPRARCSEAAPLGVEHPPRDVERGAGELVALDEGEPVEDVLRRLHVLPDDARDHMLAQRVVDGERVLRRVAGNVRRAALTPRMVT